MTTTTGRTVVLIGAGDVGVAYAFALINQGLTDKLVLVDIDEKRTWGQVQDLSHAVPWTTHRTVVTQGTYEDCADASLVCICAGAAQKPGESRLDLVGKNVAIFRSIVGSVRASGFDGIYLVASNPVDILSYVTWRLSGLPTSRVIGSGTVLDTARLRSALGNHFDIAPTSVHAYVIGEHGDTELPVYSTGSVAGVPLAERLAASEGGADAADRIFTATRDAAYDIIDAKGSTSFGIGMGLARITAAVFGNEDVALPVSVLVDGIYGREGRRPIYIGTPAVLAGAGVREVIELPLDAEETAKFAHSADTLEQVMADAGVFEL
ncbi:L-lactate dehydrogenase [Corynebacterium terpenotabidum]|uniref:L-lactate dehydrogenase n=1 Tax=Corynebacterium terpenotabidum Y-11 TaxID=1200352 RepID=S4XE02_9CORY|nr:L-lactate dehydrogenase [Corynebacterium terpenotabidum]AGP29825.1 L-lactate dehydrogenase [Corynebacterium terpenotabidum Y-11]